MSVCSFETIFSVQWPKYSKATTEKKACDKKQERVPQSVVIAGVASVSGGLREVA